MALLAGLLLVEALIMPAPLQEPGNLSEAPNPVKAAWFLLWIQELLSYSRYLIYLVLAVALYYLLLPYLPGSPEARRARWFPREQLWVNIITVITFFGIVALTVIAAFFRGENWAFVCQFW